MLKMIAEQLARRTDKSRAGLAKALGLPKSAITQLLAGKRSMKAHELGHLVTYLELDKIKIVGRVGHQGTIEPVGVEEYFELSLDEENTTIEPPIPPIPPGPMQAYEIVGDTMMPRYDDGDLIVVWVAQRKREIMEYFGQEVVARCADGKTWLRYVDGFAQSSKSVRLTSFNARAVEARIDWVGEVWMTLRAHQRRKRQRR